MDRSRAQLQILLLGFDVLERFCTCLFAIFEAALDDFDHLQSFGTARCQLLWSWCVFAESSLHRGLPRSPHDSCWCLESLQCIPVRNTSRAGELRMLRVTDNGAMRGTCKDALV